MKSFRAFFLAAASLFCFVRAELFAALFAAVGFGAGACENGVIYFNLMCKGEFRC